MLRAESALLTTGEVQRALGTDVRVEAAEADGQQPEIGNVIKAAAVESAFRRFPGRTSDDGPERPLAVTEMALVFDSGEKALRTFSHVAQAAHLRAEVDGCSVAVETVTAPSGLVSYWGFLHKEETIVILTLDTLDPQKFSVGDLRALVAAAAGRLEAASAHHKPR